MSDDDPASFDIDAAKEEWRESLVRDRPDADHALSRLKGADRDTLLDYVSELWASARRPPLTTNQLKTFRSGIRKAADCVRRIHSSQASVLIGSDRRFLQLGHDLQMLEDRLASVRTRVHGKRRPLRDDVIERLTWHVYGSTGHFHDDAVSELVAVGLNRPWSADEQRRWRRCHGVQPPKPGE